jgi:membrane associated rhomboid family serine protease
MKKLSIHFDKIGQATYVLGYFFQKLIEGLLTLGSFLQIAVETHIFGLMYVIYIKS